MSEKNEVDLGKEKISAKWHFVLFFIVTLICLLLLNLMRLFGRIKFIGKENVPVMGSTKNKGNLLVISNHPSWFDILLAYYPFSKEFLFHPRRVPFMIANKQNVEKKLFFKPLWSRIVGVLKGKFSRESYKQFLAESKAVISNHRTLIMFPEGSRTSSAPPDELMFSDEGKAMRSFQRGGIERLILPGVRVLLMRIDDTDKILPRDANFPRVWRKCQIKVGPTFMGEELLEKGKNLKSFLEQEMLRLADNDFSEAKKEN